MTSSILNISAIVAGIFWSQNSMIKVEMNVQCKYKHIYL